ncbi:MAG: iron-sulfur cluster assembly scaffold protein [Pyrinomonadaceae bacterium]
MAFYPEGIDERFRSPANAGAGTDGVRGTSASFVCGSFVELSVRINIESGSISGASFKTNGCGFMIATADALCDWLCGKTLAELHGLHDDELLMAVCALIGPLPRDRVQCSGVVFESLRKAMSLHREQCIDEFRGETPLICTCFGVSEESIIGTIAENGFTEVDQVAEASRAGSGCGSCRFLIQELIDMRAVGLD